MNHLPPSPGFKDDLGSNTIFINVVTQVPKLTTKSETDTLWPASERKRQKWPLGSNLTTSELARAGLSVRLDPLLARVHPRIPWQWWRRGKSNCYMFTFSKRCILIASTMVRGAVVSCACNLMLLFCVLFCLFTAVNNVSFGLVINWTPSKRRPVESGCCCDGDLGFERTCMAYPEGQPWVKGPCPRLQGQSCSHRPRTEDRRISKVLVPRNTQGKDVHNALTWILFRDAHL